MAHSSRPAAQAFDAIAPIFDARFENWESVAAQRRAVRRALAQAFPVRSRILEVGGGTGEDAVWLARQGHHVTLTDASAAMVRQARIKLAPLGGEAHIAAAEDLGLFADEHLGRDGTSFDGAFSNFAPLNCVEDLTPVACGLARLINPGGRVLLVLFGILSPGEILVEMLRGRSSQALRRFGRGPVSAQLGGKQFDVIYHSGAVLERAMRPWFRPVRRLGIGVFVPPSAAEPWISRHPEFLKALERLDRFAERPLALLGDHILYQFERNP